MWGLSDCKTYKFKAAEGRKPLECLNSRANLHLGKLVAFVYESKITKRKNTGKQLLLSASLSFQQT
jgi:hypothetical protein